MLHINDYVNIDELVNFMVLISIILFYIMGFFSLRETHLPVWKSTGVKLFFGQICHFSTHEQIHDVNFYDGSYLDNQPTNRGIEKRKKKPIYTRLCCIRFNVV